MIVKFSKSFNKAFSNLDSQDQELSMDTIEFFKDNPEHPSLRNHLLEAPMSGKRSITVRDDLRIIFIERGNYVQVLMLDVGDHEAVYEV